jgi:putative ABC transport system substrate-binding protein
VITADTLFSSKSVELAALAFRHAVPTISPYREFVAAGGLMSYGGSVTELYRLIGSIPAASLRASSRPICRFSS